MISENLNKMVVFNKIISLYDKLSYIVVLCLKTINNYIKAQNNGYILDQVVLYGADNETTVRSTSPLPGTTQSSISFG